MRVQVGTGLLNDANFWKIVDWTLHIADNRLAHVVFSCGLEVSGVCKQPAAFCPGCECKSCPLHFSATPATRGCVQICLTHTPASACAATACTLTSRGQAPSVPTSTQSSTRSSATPWALSRGAHKQSGHRHRQRHQRPPPRKQTLLQKALFLLAAVQLPRQCCCLQLLQFFQARHFLSAGLLCLRSQCCRLHRSHPWRWHPWPVNRLTALQQRRQQVPLRRRRPTRQRVQRQQPRWTLLSCFCCVATAWILPRSWARDNRCLPQLHHRLPLRLNSRKLLRPRTQPHLCQHHQRLLQRLQAFRLTASR